MTFKSIFLIQGIYYVITGMWPLVHLKSFEAISGNKKDHWLVFTVGLLILSSGLVFLYGALNRENVTPEIILLSVANTLSFIFIDVYFSWKKVIRKVYLMDGLIEFLILIGVLYVAARH